MEDIDHFGFIQFYTDKGSVELQQTFVFVFCEQLELRQKLVHAEFFSKSTISLTQYTKGERQMATPAGQLLALVHSKTQFRHMVRRSHAGLC